LTENLAARIGIDVGGTFTDLVCIDRAGVVHTAKVSSTPDNQAIGVFSGVDALAAQYGLNARELLGQTEAIVHGTTVAANIMLEFNGAKLGLLTTFGFRDIIDLRRNYKEVSFDIRYPAPEPIVRRRYRIGITERMDSEGKPVTPLAESQVLEALDFFYGEGIESIAVCYLFSFVNPAHELRTRELISQRLPGIPVSLSHEVLPKVREFERLSATLVDAYTTPALERYLTRLRVELLQKGYRGEIYVMANNGGMLRIDSAIHRAVDLALSGPAGGVVAGSQLALKSGFDRVITADMGGTSYDICLSEGGRARLGTDGWINRYRVAVPSLDLHVIGAGGGSIAWVDDGGALRVGPQSAGARPGPACYGRGGDRATVTDADLLLGYISPDSFLGGAMPLDAEKSRIAVERHIAKPLGLDVLEAAAGIFRIVNHNMANGVRHVTTVGGDDPRDFALVAFGGAGAIHATPQALDIGIKAVLVPRNFAPVLCALGDLIADHRVTRAQGFYGRMSSVDLAGLNEAFRLTAARALADLGDGVERSEVELGCAFEMRYIGQTHEVDVPVKLYDGRISADSLANVGRRFHDLHEQRFSIRKEADEIEILGITVDACAMHPKPVLPVDRETAVDVLPTALKGHRKAYFGVEYGFLEAAVLRGEQLQAGNLVNGPAIIEEAHTSIVIYPGQQARLDGHQMYVLTAA
jgi:N-methylhydantoinase A